MEGEGRKRSVELAGPEEDGFLVRPSREEGVSERRVGVSDLLSRNWREQGEGEVLLSSNREVRQALNFASRAARPNSRFLFHTSPFYSTTHPALHFKENYDRYTSDDERGSE